MVKQRRLEALSTLFSGNGYLYTQNGELSSARTDIIEAVNARSGVDLGAHFKHK